MEFPVAREVLRQGTAIGRQKRQGASHCRKKKKEEGGRRVEKPSIRRNSILLIEYFLKTKEKRKITIKEKYKVRGLKPLK